MGDRALNVVTVKALVEIDGGGKSLDKFVSGLGETASPGFFAHYCYTPVLKNETQQHSPQRTQRKQSTNRTQVKADARSLIQNQNRFYPRLSEVICVQKDWNLWFHPDYPCLFKDVGFFPCPP
jgi:hypothetical protein